MGKEIMCASIMTAIILCIVGIIKILPPCLSFKEKHPKWYKGIFYSLSLIFAIAFPVISELYILNGSLTSVEFLVLIITTVAGVFGLYTSYEGLGLKELAKKLVEKFGELINKFQDSKLSKVVKKIGVDKILEIDAQNKQKEIEAQSKLEEKKAALEAKRAEKEAKKLEKGKTKEEIKIAEEKEQQIIENTTQDNVVASTENITPVNSATPTNTTNVF